MTVSIRPYIPFEIAYVEEFETQAEAIKREKYFKSAGGRKFLKKMLASKVRDHPDDTSQTDPLG